MDRITYYATWEKFMSNTGEIIKPRKLHRDGIDPDRGFEPLKKVERWRNVIVLNNGSHVSSCRIHPTEQCARLTHDDLTMACNEKEKKGVQISITHHITGDHMYWWHEHKLAFQLPVP